MSGTNSLLDSVTTKKGGNYSALSKDLLNANEVAKQQDKKGAKKQAKKK